MDSAFLSFAQNNLDKNSKKKSQNSELKKDIFSLNKN